MLKTLSSKQQKKKKKKILRNEAANTEILSPEKQNKIRQNIHLKYIILKIVTEIENNL